MVVFAPNGWFVALAALVSFATSNLKHWGRGLLGIAVTVILGSVQAIASGAICFSMFTQAGAVSQGLSSFAYRAASIVGFGAVAANALVIAFYRLSGMKGRLMGSLAFIMTVFPIGIYAVTVLAFVFFRIQFDFGLLKVANLAEGGIANATYLCLAALAFLAAFVVYAFVWQLCVLGLHKRAASEESDLPVRRRRQSSSSLHTLRKRLCTGYSVGAVVWTVMLFGAIVMCYAALSASTSLSFGFIYIGFASLLPVTNLAFDIARCNISMDTDDSGK